MKQFHINRLLKLADFLDKLPRKKFDYSTVVNGTDIPRKTLDCGSMSCAIGWCPVVFPKLVRYDKGFFGKNLVRPIGGPGDFMASSRALFGLGVEETSGLFQPRDQHLIGEKNLPNAATPKQVAKLIRRFVARKLKEKAQKP